MTGTTPVILALSLILFDFTLICDANATRQDYASAKFVFLNGVSLLLITIPIIPAALKAFMPVVCFILETIISMILLEMALLMVFKTVQQYVRANSDYLMSILTRSQVLRTFVCEKCCEGGGNQCPQFVEELLLKLISLGFLLCITTNFSVKL